MTCLSVDQYVKTSSDIYLCRLTGQGPCNIRIFIVVHVWTWLPLSPARHLAPAASVSLPLKKNSTRLLRLRACCGAATMLFCDLALSPCASESPRDRAAAGFQAGVGCQYRRLGTLRRRQVGLAPQKTLRPLCACCGAANVLSCDLALSPCASESPRNRAAGGGSALK